MGGHRPVWRFRRPGDSAAQPPARRDRFYALTRYRTSEYTYAWGAFQAGSSNVKASRLKEVLTCRCIDRPVRPLFPSGCGTNADHRARPVGDQGPTPTCWRSQAPLPRSALSEIRSRRRSRGVRRRARRRQIRHQPDFQQRKDSNWIWSSPAARTGLVMVEAGAKEVNEDQVVEALDAAHAGHQRDRRRHRRARPPRRARRSSRCRKRKSPRLLPRGRGKSRRAAHRGDAHSRQARKSDRVTTRGRTVVASIPEGVVERKLEAKAIFKELKEKVHREEVLTHGVLSRRPEVREVRPILGSDRRSATPRTGRPYSRGETQALVTCTLGTADDAQKVESFEAGKWKASCSTTLPAILGGGLASARPGRREVGHGALAERSLAQ